MIKRKGGNVCSVINCKSKSYNCNLRFFAFPSDPIRAKEWAIAAGRQDLLKKIEPRLSGYRICELHFEKKYFSTPDCRRLLAQAKPTIFPQPLPLMTDHTYTAGTILINIEDSRSQNSAMLEETSSSPDTDELLLHHEVQIKSESVSPTSFLTTNTIGTQTQKVTVLETSLKHQISFLTNDNNRLRGKIKKLNDQLEEKRRQILKTLTLDEFKEILNSLNESEKVFNDSGRQTEFVVLGGRPQQSDDDAVNPEEVVKPEYVVVKKELASTFGDVVVKMEDASTFEDVVNMEDAEGFEEVRVKVEDVVEWEDVVVKTEDTTKWEDVVVKTEDTTKWEDVVKVEDVVVKMESE